VKCLEQIQRFSPEVIVDLILSSGEQARQLISLDVYRAWGVVHQSEPVLWKRCPSQKIRGSEPIVSSTRQRLLSDNC
jgi:hypothetical protein